MKLRRRKSRSGWSAPTRGILHVPDPVNPPGDGPAILRLSDPEKLVRVHTADRPFLDAFARVLADDPDTAADIVRGMSGRDRAVLQFHLTELCAITDAVETERRARRSPDT